MFYSDAKQDSFTANILNFKKNGSYVDIGACHSIHSNNTFYFDSNLDWKGLCVEMNPEHNSSFSSRKGCLFLNSDATKLNYNEIFEQHNFPKDIDYLSLDIDTLSTSVLDILPFEKYKFKVITIEHDFYIYGNEYKLKQRDFLTKKGYCLLCSDVYVEPVNPNNPKASFEDWWIYPSFFDEEIIAKLKSDNEYPSNILDKFKFL